MSNNLNIGQVTANTADKDDFLNDLFALIDSSVTANIAVDASASAAVPIASIQNYLKITAANTPAGGTTLTLPPISRMFIIKNDKASLGNVTYACGNASVTIPPGLSTIVYMDGTANGLEVVSSSAGTLAALKDIDFSTAPADGQVLTYSGTATKWKPATPAVSEGGGGGGGGTPAPGTAAHKYWRFLVLNTDEFPTLDSGGFVTFAELAFYDAANAKIATSGGSIIVVNENSSYPVANIFDGDATTIVSTADRLTSYEKYYVGYAFASATAVASVKITASTGYANHTPHDFAIQYSDDGFDWTTGHAVYLTGAAWNAGEVRSYPITIK